MEKSEVLKAARDKYFSISDIKDLRKNKITLSDHCAIYDILKSFCQDINHIEKTFISSVAEWFRSNGFKVIYDNESSFIIQL